MTYLYTGDALSFWYIIIIAILIVAVERSELFLVL